MRAAVGVVGTVVAGLPPSAEQPRRDPSAQSPRLGAISEAEPLAGDDPNAHPESQPSQVEDRVDGKDGKRADASETERSNARKRSAPAAQLEIVPEQNKRIKRRTRSPAAKPDKASAVDGSPSVVIPLEKSGKNPAAVSLAADAAEDAVAADPQPGDTIEVVQTLAPS